MVVEATNPAKQEIGSPKRQRKQVQRIRSSELRATNNRASQAKGTDKQTGQPKNTEGSVVSERVPDTDDEDDDEDVIIISLSKASEGVDVWAPEAYARGVGGGASTLWNLVECQVCRLAEDLEHMILCDECDGGTCNSHLRRTASCTPAFSEFPPLRAKMIFVSSLR